MLESQHAKRCLNQYSPIGRLVNAGGSITFFPQETFKLDFFQPHFAIYIHKPTAAKLATYLPLSVRNRSFYQVSRIFYIFFLNEGSSVAQGVVFGSANIMGLALPCLSLWQLGNILLASALTTALRTPPLTTAYSLSLFYTHYHDDLSILFKCSTA